MNSLSFYIIFVQRSHRHLENPKNHHLENPKTLVDLLFEGLWFNKTGYLGGLRKFWATWAVMWHGDSTKFSILKQNLQNFRV